MFSFPVSLTSERSRNTPCIRTSENRRSINQATITKFDTRLRGPSVRKRVNLPAAAQGRASNPMSYLMRVVIGASAVRESVPEGAVHGAIDAERALGG